MSPSGLLPVGLGLLLALIGLAGASKHLDLWLDRQDSPATAQANALDPIINCLNQMDVPLRLVHQAYQAAGAPRATAAGAYDISVQGGQDIETVYRYACGPNMTKKLRIIAPDSPLLAATEHYQQVLGAFVVLTKDSFMQRMGFGRPLTEEQLDLLVSQLGQQSEAYLAASKAVRQWFPALDIEPRSQQLLRLEQRLGRTAHWALLEYMIQARSTVDLIDEGVRNKTLTPGQVAESTRQLRQAWSARQQFLNIGQPDKSTQDVLYLWQLIAAPSQRYLEALDTLHQDWLAHAEPQRLSEDFHAVTQGYDQMLYHYNKLARKQY